MTIEKAIKSRVAVLCQERNISLDALCATCKLDPITIGSIDDGTSMGISYDAIARICYAFGMDMSDFFNIDIFRSTNL